MHIERTVEAEAALQVNFAFKMMDFVFKMMDFVFKMAALQIRHVNEVINQQIKVAICPQNDEFSFKNGEFCIYK